MKLYSAEIRKPGEKMKKFPAILLSVIMILSFTACGKNDISQETDLSGPDTVSIEKTDADTGVLPQKFGIISKNRFTDHLSGLGEVNDITEKNGFDACFIKSEKVNYIYMFLSDEKMAEELLREDTDNGAEDAYFNVLQTGQNYEYSESISARDSEGRQQYSCNLRVDNMLIVIAGDINDREFVFSKASPALEELGYPLS